MKNYDVELAFNAENLPIVSKVIIGGKYIRTDSKVIS
jgi:hypothetical protein